jgi:CBS domain-containing protein
MLSTPPRTTLVTTPVVSTTSVITGVSPVIPFPLSSSSFSSSSPSSSSCSSSSSPHITSKTISSFESPQLFNKPFGKPIVCTKNHTLKYVLGQLAQHNIHRLIIVDEEGRLAGLVSVNDILKLFITT